MTTETPTQAPPNGAAAPAIPSTPDEAQRRFWKRYGWALIERALGPFPQPTTVDGWISVAEAVRDLLATPVGDKVSLAPTMGRMAEALERMAEALERTPIVASGAAPQAQAGPPVCEFHGPMKESTAKPGTWFCSKKMGDGVTYCKSRG